MSWLRTAVEGLRASVRISALLTGLRAFAASRLKAARRAFVGELRAQGLPARAVAELGRAFEELGRELVRQILSPRALGDLLALRGPRRR